MRGMKFMCVLVAVLALTGCDNKPGSAKSPSANAASDQTPSNQTSSVGKAAPASSGTASPFAARHPEVTSGADCKSGLKERGEEPTRIVPICACADKFILAKKNADYSAADLRDNLKASCPAYRGSLSERLDDPWGDTAPPRGPVLPLITAAPPAKAPAKPATKK